MGNICCPTKADKKQLLEVVEASPPPKPKAELTEKQKAEKEARAAERAAEAAKEAKKAELLEDDDETFYFDWGQDFPQSFNAMHMAFVHGHPINSTMGPKQLLSILAEKSEFRAATPRRPGKGKPLAATSSEGEMETQARKDCQKAVRRLIVPKAEKDEVPEAFIRRLDAHRSSPEVLIPPMTPPEDQVLFMHRCTAIKEQADKGLVTPANMVILPKSKQEDVSEFEERLNVAKACPALALPRGMFETSPQFKERMRHQKKCKRPIMPASRGENGKGFSFRCETQILCAYVIHPFDGGRETEETYMRRLQAQKSKVGICFAPGDAEKINGFLGPPSAPKPTPAAKKPAVDEEEEDIESV